MTTLDNTYCRPTTEADVSTLVNIDCAYLKHYPEQFLVNDKIMIVDGMMGVWFNSTRTEIPVQHFIDLLEDRICAWRLEDEFFIQQNGDELTRDFQKSCKDCEVEIMFEDGHFQDVRIISKSFDYIDTNIQTFTDLLTLIRFLK